MSDLIDDELIASLDDDACPYCGAITRETEEACGYRDCPRREGERG